ncbi:whey acidic protein-like [Puma concolor]|uniref:Whey acidic protein-like n=1 Tax=Puma concolor TaxID=9696 RepID=A0A6P6HSN9_PUMCO|nr:whey acidic protein-like [Puma concolor]
MRCLASLALVLLALEAAVALAAAPAFTVPGQAMCPELSSSEEDSCVVSCSTDDDCPQGIRCCPRSPCSRSCVFPVMAPLQKAGRCPRVPVPLAPEPCSESTECSVDSQCAGSRKCCFSTCAMRCLDPATVGSGEGREGVGVESSLAHLHTASIPPLPPPCTSEASVSPAEDPLQ